MWKSGLALNALTEDHDAKESLTRAYTQIPRVAKDKVGPDHAGTDGWGQFIRNTLSVTLKKGCR